MRVVVGHPREKKEGKMLTKPVTRTGVSRMRSLLALGLAGSLMAVGCASGAGKGETAAIPSTVTKDYFAGKTVTLILPNSPSGTMDAYARMMVPYLTDHIGAANVVVENNSTAGGVAGLNDVWQADPDGMTLGFTAVPTIILAGLVQSPGVEFKATGFSYLGRAATVPRVLTVGANSGIQSVANIKGLTRPFAYPVQGLESDFFIMAALGSGLGFDIKWVSGYKNNADTSLAVVSGDVDGHTTSITASKPAIKAGDKRLLLVIGNERLDAYPNVPTTVEVAEDAQSKRVLQAIVDMVELQRSFFAPPDMKPQLTEYLRNAVKKTLQDPELQEEAKEAGLPLAFMSGEEVQQKTESVFDASQDVTPILEEALKELQ